jgi:hypothetical protein
MQLPSYVGNDANRWLCLEVRCCLRQLLVAVEGLGSLGLRLYVVICILRAQMAA